MPVISFEAGQLTPEVKANLIEKLTVVSAEITSIPKELFFVSIKELPDDDIAVGGITVREMKEKLATER